jgi:hypothetical protein
MAKDKKSNSDLFVSLDDFLGERKRSSMALWAETGLGKTYLALSCPKPIFLLNFEPDGPYWALRNAKRNGLISNGDVRISEVLRDAFKDEDAEPDVVRTLYEDQVIYDYTLEILKRITTDEHEGTVIIDTGTELWHICDLVESEEIVRKREKQGKERYPFDYRKSNRAFRSIIDRVNHSDLNLLVLNHAQNPYSSKGQAQRKKWEYHGNNHLSKWVDVFFRLRSEIGDEDLSITRWAEIQKCRLDDKLHGVEIDNPTWDVILDELYPQEEE